MATTSFFSSTGPTNTETDAIESSVNAAAASQAAAATSESNAAASEAAAVHRTVRTGDPVIGVIGVSERLIKAYE